MSAMSARFVDLCRCDKGIVSLVQGFYKEIVTLLNDGWNVSANSLASSMMISPSSTSFWALSIFSSMLSMVSAWNKTLVCGQRANFRQKIPDSQPVRKTLRTNCSVPQYLLPIWQFLYAFLLLESNSQMGSETKSENNLFRTNDPLLSIGLVTYVLHKIGWFWRINHFPNYFIGWSLSSFWQIDINIKELSHLGMSNITHLIPTGLSSVPDSFLGNSSIPDCSSAKHPLS